MEESKLEKTLEIVNKFGKLITSVFSPQSSYTFVVRCPC